MEKLLVSIKYLEEINYFKDGNDFEKYNWDLIKCEFSLMEKFWRLFVVPMTNRIDPEKKGKVDYNDHRDNVDKMILRIGINFF